MIVITGDLHGDKSRFKLIKKAKIKKRDTLIICGDFGFIWDGTKEETKVLNWIAKRKYQICFVDGYHDNLDLLKNYPVTQWNGGKVREMSKKLHMLMRGEVFEIDGKTIFAFGGGDSLEREQDSAKDKEKLPSPEEIENAKQNLLRVDNKVDLIVTHDTPTRIKFFIDMDNNELNHLHTFLEGVSKTVSFKKWYIGKYHFNKIIPPCYHMLFTDVIKID